MHEQIAIQNLLQKCFLESRLRNPSYSLRAFAKKAGISPGAMSAILNGKRNVSKKLVDRIAEKLALDPMTRAEIRRRFPKGRSFQNEMDSELKTSIQLSADQFHIISEWYHFGILSLIRTRNSKSHPEWIAKRLGIKSSEARQAIDRLLRIGLLVQDKKGKLSRGAAQYRTTDDIRNASLQKSHLTNLELAKKSLESDPVNTRDFTAATMAIDPKRLPEAKERIRAFQDELSDLLESGDQTEVYKLCIQMFPLTKLENS